MKIKEAIDQGESISNKMRSFYLKYCSKSMFDSVDSRGLKYTCFSLMSLIDSIYALKKGIINSVKNIGYEEVISASVLFRSLLESSITHDFIYKKHFENIMSDSIGELYCKKGLIEELVNIYRLKHYNETISKAKMFSFFREVNNGFKDQTDQEIEYELKTLQIFQIKNMLNYLTGEQFDSIKKEYLEYYNLCSGYVHGSTYSDHKLNNMDNIEKEKYLIKVIGFANMMYVHAMYFTNSVFYFGANYYNDIKTEKEIYFREISELFGSTYLL